MKVRKNKWMLFCKVNLSTKWNLILPLFVPIWMSILVDLTLLRTILEIRTKVIIIRDWIKLVILTITRSRMTMNKAIKATLPIWLRVTALSPLSNQDKNQLLFGRRIDLRDWACFVMRRRKMILLFPHRGFLPKNLMNHQIHSANPFGLS